MKDIKEFLELVSSAEEAYKISKATLELEKARLYLKTDFKELGYTNEKTRNAYVDRKVEELNSTKIMNEIDHNHLQKVFQIAMKFPEIGLELIKETVEEYQDIEPLKTEEPQQEDAAEITEGVSNED